MANQDDEEFQNMRLMWIGSGVIVLFIVGLMGLNMLGIIGNSGTCPDRHEQPVADGAGEVRRKTECSRQ